MNKDRESSIYKIRHSAAHILFQAVRRIFGDDVKPAIGPVTDNGFFYDLLAPKQICEPDLERIEAEMHKIVEENFEIVGEQVTKDKARGLYKNNQFKLEIIDRIPSDTVGIYTQGEMFDLCQGGHTERTGDVKHFKLMSVAGSYWKGDRNNPQLQRISGVAFESAKELRIYLQNLEQAKKFDHRLTGKDQDLFFFSQYSPGMVFFKPKGTVVFNLLIDFVRGILQKYKYQEIRTPLLLKEELWHQSGHYDNYRENMYFCDSGDEKYCLRPMNCPCAVLVFREGLRSYKELPLRLAEFGMVHRYELSGALHGLFRVRNFTQDDAHVFCMPDQIENEVRTMLKMAKEVYDKFGFENIKYCVSTRPEKSIGDDASWEHATKSLSNALEAEGLKYEVNEGDGAFYGPKIDIYLLDAFARQWQCGTVQVDPFLPERFGIEYVASDQQRKKPIMLHRALLGSVERFLAICLENYKAKLPFWLSPVQCRVLTISQEQNKYAQEVLDQLQLQGFRVDSDFVDDNISAKIKVASTSKIPTMLLIGDKELAAGVVTLRFADGKQRPGISLNECFDILKEL